MALLRKSRLRRRSHMHAIGPRTPRRHFPSAPPRRFCTNTDTDVHSLASRRATTSLEMAWVEPLPARIN